MDVVFGKHWLSLCSDSKGEFIQEEGDGAFKVTWERNGGEDSVCVFHLLYFH